MKNNFLYKYIQFPNRNKIDKINNDFFDCGKLKLDHYCMTWYKTDNPRKDFFYCKKLKLDSYWKALYKANKDFFDRKKMKPNLYEFIINERIGNYFDTLLILDISLVEAVNYYDIMLECDEDLAIDYEFLVRDKLKITIILLCSLFDKLTFIFKKSIKEEKKRFYRIKKSCIKACNMDTKIINKVCSFFNNFINDAKIAEIFNIRNKEIHELSKIEPCVAGYQYEIKYLLDLIKYFLDTLKTSMPDIDKGIAEHFFLHRNRAQE